MRALNKVLIVGAALFIIGQSNAISKTVEFSADAVINTPQQATKKFKIFVSTQAVRREMNMNGQDVVEIVYPEQGKALLINDQMRSFKERRFPAQSKDDNKTPCAQISNSICEKIGSENIDGIKTEKWQIISNENGKNMRTLHWIDVKRKLAIREFFPDGSVSELKMIKKEKINKRNTEKWERTLSRPDGKNIKSYQWYDKQLKIAIKEVRPNGFSRELKNVKVGKQKDKLFELPVGYMQVGNRPSMRN
jgi:Domain of unknown function (DUF4412)